MSKANTITSTITSIAQYPTLLTGLQDCSGQDRVDHLRNLCRTDLYFLLRYAMARPDVEHPWVFARCREVQASPNGHLDLWAREHYKSTIITFALTIQDILNDPDITFGVFSHTRPIAKGFMRQIKRELEGNEQLKGWFPDIFWDNPQKEAPKWSEDDGIIVRRKSNPKESTVEAWGLVDGQPTSKHFRILLYDDVVTRESVTTPDMIKKTTEAYQLSDNLGTEGGAKRIVGTRYHYGDTYRDIIASGGVVVRQYPCTVNGEEEFSAGNCVLMQPETLKRKRRDQGPYTFGAQMLLNPKGDALQGFRREWLRYLDAPVERQGLNVYLLCDPANEKRKENDYTSIFAIGLGEDENIIILDMVRDRLNLAERTRWLMDLHRKWKPLKVGYEKYGKDSDIQHIQSEQRRLNYRFPIVELGGATPKPDRIKRLIPLFEQGRIYLPSALHRVNYEGTLVDLVHTFVEEEYCAFPVAVHDDMLDCLARVEHPDFPMSFPSASRANLATENCSGHNPLAA